MPQSAIFIMGNLGQF